MADYQLTVLGDPGGGDSDPPGNVDVEVRDSSGRWSATFFTLDNIRSLFEKNASTGECAGGLYLWAADMILVWTLDRATIEHTVADLRATGEFETAFARLDPLDS